MQRTCHRGWSPEGRYLYTRPAMLRRCLQHYGWNTAQFDMIDWTAYHGALQKLRFAEKKLVTKFIHQSLPAMGKIFNNKIDPSQSITCSSCQRQPNPRHTCTHAPPAKPTWRTSSRRHIPKFPPRKSHLPLTRIHSPRRPVLGPSRWSLSSYTTTCIVATGAVGFLF